jgi:hypothetical protein
MNNQIPPKPARRTSPHIFDRIFRELLHLSSRAIISFINGLFHTRYPLDHSVKELEDRGMALLLPIYVMKMRD